MQKPDELPNLVNAEVPRTADQLNEQVAPRRHQLGLDAPAGS
jgi:hypothetical protein